MDFKLMRSDESLPALSNTSCNTPMRSGHFAWSSKNQDFDTERTDDDIVDEETRWAICLRLHDNRFSGFAEETAIVDITPRR
jgi:hypothetical protein